MTEVKIGQMVRFPKKFNVKGEVIMKEGMVKSIMGNFCRIRYKNKVNWAFWEGHIEQLVPYIEYKEEAQGLTT